MGKKLDASVAKSLEMEGPLLPFVPELLKGMWSLGSAPNLVVDILGPLGLEASSTKILDLGCGKGAVSITLARDLGFHAVGIDACRPFLKEAESRAAEFGVSHLCRFELADMRTYVKNAVDFDVVIFASVGGILGRFDRTVGYLRKTVRPGGYMVIDEGFVKGKKRLDRAGYEHLFPHRDTLEQLSSHGDRMLKEILMEEEIVEMNRVYMDVIRKNAQTLVKRNPEIREHVLDYIRNQEEECEVIDKNFTGAVWLLQRTE